MTSTAKIKASEKDLAIKLPLPPGTETWAGPVKGNLNGWRKFRGWNIVQRGTNCILKLIELETTVKASCTHAGPRGSQGGDSPPLHANHLSLSESLSTDLTSNHCHPETRLMEKPCGVYLKALPSQEPGNATGKRQARASYCFGVKEPVDVSPK